MYILVYSEEIATKLRFVDIAKDTVTPREGFIELERKEFIDHMKAVHAMLRGRTDSCKYNKIIDPNYIPPSKRKLSF